ncbi:hypothetical protein JYU34_012501 [Plutella xylostella]|uniref:THAP-type domain-containing protein n=1 Tax=Plutella xylostella TaxID=51655 RepID=A0ABQ7QBG6_PLUXY|nr:hypothetical protein JYU34_012501 [Plutella xylostella]
MANSHRTCEICGVKERHSDEKHIFFRFPLDKNRCMEWVKVVGKEDLAYLPLKKLHSLRYVCGKHFSKRDFTKSKTRLKRLAIPNLHLTSAPLSDSIVAEFLLLNLNVAAKGKHEVAEVVPAAPVAIQPVGTAVASTSASEAISG